VLWGELALEEAICRKTDRVVTYRNRLLLRKCREKHLTAAEINAPFRLECNLIQCSVCMKSHFL
jgi:hypothetical protein